MPATSPLFNPELLRDLPNADRSAVQHDADEIAVPLFVASDVLQKPQIDRPRAARIDRLNVARIEQSGRHRKGLKIAITFCWWLFGHRAPTRESGRVCCSGSNLASPVGIGCELTSPVDPAAGGGEE